MQVFDSFIYEFRNKFSDANACIELAQRMKWPGGYRCTYCGYERAFMIETRTLPLYECKNCNYQESLTANTMMHKSRTPLEKWLLVIYIVTNSEQSINAVQLSSLIKVTYKTAWGMLHKVRMSLSHNDEFIKLTGNVEMKHEVFMKQQIPTDERLSKEKSVVVASGKLEKGASEYFKIKIIQRQKQARDVFTHNEQKQCVVQLCSIAHDHVLMNPRFQQIAKLSRTHNSSSDVRSLFALSLVAKDAFSWINESFHGIGAKYAQSYLDEYCFRLNGKRGSISCPFHYVLKLVFQPRSYEHASSNKAAS